jgi:hypothetical protein
MVLMQLSVGKLRGLWSRRVQQRPAREHELECKYFADIYARVGHIIAKGTSFWEVPLGLERGYNE